MNSAMSSRFDRQGRRPWLPGRRGVIALVVVGLHAGALWVLQNGLLMRTPEVVVPVAMIGQWVASPAATPTPVSSVATPTTPPRPVTETRKAPPPAKPQPLAIPEPSSLPTALETPSQGAMATAHAAPPAATIPSTSATAVAAAGNAGGAVQLPSSDADYLQNPKPPYPPLSERLGEQGNVIYKVWIGTDGRAQRAELVSSSGFARLDKAAYDTVMHWRYVPGKRNGVPEAMAFNVPIRWQLRGAN